MNHSRRHPQNCIPNCGWTLWVSCNVIRSIQCALHLSVHHERAFLWRVTKVYSLLLWCYTCLQFFHGQPLPSSGTSILEARPKSLQRKALQMALFNHKHRLFGTRHIRNWGASQSRQNWIHPTMVRTVNFTTLNGFLGLTGYYRRFVPGYATTATDLTDLLWKSTFSWTPEATKSFQRLK